MEILTIDLQRNRIVVRGYSAVAAYSRLKELWYRNRALTCHDFPVDMQGPEPVTKDMYLPARLVPKMCLGEYGHFFWNVDYRYDGWLRSTGSTVSTVRVPKQDE